MNTAVRLGFVCLLLLILSPSCILKAVLSLVFSFYVPLCPSSPSLHNEEKMRFYIDRLPKQTPIRANYLTSLRVPFHLQMRTIGIRCQLYYKYNVCFGPSTVRFLLLYQNSPLLVFITPTGPLWKYGCLRKK